MRRSMAPSRSPARREGRLAWGVPGGGVERLPRPGINPRATNQTKSRLKPALRSVSRSGKMYLEKEIWHALLAAFLPCGMGHAVSGTGAGAGGGAVRPLPDPGEGSGDGGGRSFSERDGGPRPPRGLPAAEDRASRLRGAGEGRQLHAAESVPPAGSAFFLAGRVFHLLPRRQAPAAPCRLRREPEAPSRSIHCDPCSRADRRRLVFLSRLQPAFRLTRSPGIHARADRRAMSSTD